MGASSVTLGAAAAATPTDARRKAIVRASANTAARTGPLLAVIATPLQTMSFCMPDLTRRVRAAVPAPRRLARLRAAQRLRARLRASRSHEKAPLAAQNEVPGRRPPSAGHLRDRPLASSLPRGRVV